MMPLIASDIHIYGSLIAALARGDIYSDFFEDMYLVSFHCELIHSNINSD
jgi:hypothetical protein